MANDTIIAHDAYLAFGGTVLSTRYRTFSPEETAETVDTTSGDDDYVTREVTVIDAKASLEIVLPGGTAGTATWAAVKPGNRGTLEWAPQGTAATAVRHYASDAVCVKRGKPLNYRDVTVVSIDFEVSSNVVDTVYS